MDPRRANIGQHGVSLRSIVHGPLHVLRLCQVVPRGALRRTLPNDVLQHAGQRMGVLQRRRQHRLVARDGRSQDACQPAEEVGDLAGGAQSCVQQRWLWGCRREHRCRCNHAISHILLRPDAHLTVATAGAPPPSTNTFFYIQLLH